jgi:hypothetical protein
MKAFATYSDLIRLGRETDATRLLKEASTREGKTVFLSHSSSDNDLVPGAVSILEGNGGKVYVDSKDSALKEMEMLAIANRLRSAVRICRKFVLLVTPRSTDSKWIPWELGLGDGANHDVNVALFPSAESILEQKWSEQEYLGLYQRIIWGDFNNDGKGQWLVLDHRENTGKRLADWLQS